MSQTNQEVYEFGAFRLEVAVGLYLLFGGNRSTKNEIRAIAILPFVNASADLNAEYLSDGIAESLINGLSQLSKLKVIARTTAFRYKGKEMDPQAWRSPR